MPSLPIFTPEALNSYQIPADKRQVYLASPSHPGLQYQVSRTGRRSWHVQWAEQGRTKRVKLSDSTNSVTFDEINEVWAQARETRNLVLQGEDPTHERNLRQLANARSNITWAEVWTKYSTSPKFRKLRGETQRSYTSAFQNYVQPTIGNRPVAGLSLPMFLDIYESWTAGGRKGMARLGVIVVQNLWKFADRYEMLPGDLKNPLRYLNDELPEWDSRPIKKTDIPDDILPSLWAQTYLADEFLSPDPKGAAIRFGLCTGLRKQEISRLRWDEVHGLQEPGAYIHLDAARVKTGRELKLPLNSLAREILLTMRYDRPSEGHVSDFVFGRHAANRAKYWAELTGEAMPRASRRKPPTLASDLPLGVPNPALRRMVTAAGGAPVSFHTLRKVWARVVLAATSDVYAVKKLLNHATYVGATANYLVEDFGYMAGKSETAADYLRDILGSAHKWREPSSLIYKVEVLGH